MMMDTTSKNVFRFCPFCGSAHFEWDGQKAHICQDCGHKLYINEAGATIALIHNDKNEYLFTRRRFDPAKGMLDLPGGFIDLEETAEHAMIREVKEELNLEVTKLNFVATFPNTYQYAGLTYYTIDIVFDCQVEDFSPLTALDDVQSATFLPLEKIDIEQIGLKSVKEVVKMLKIRCSR